MKKLLLLILVICIALPWSCKKYEEDDYWFTLRTPLNRIKGNKRLVMGSISSDDYKDFFLKPIYFTFSNEKLETLDAYHLFIMDSLTQKKICEGMWGFNYPGNQKNKGRFFINLNYTAEYPISSCLGVYDTSQAKLNLGGDILKLSKKELWVGSKINNEVYNKFELYEN